MDTRVHLEDTRHMWAWWERGRSLLYARDLRRIGPEVLKLELGRERDPWHRGRVASVLEQRP